MRYGFIAVAAGLAWFLLVSVATSIGIAVFVRGAVARQPVHPARTRASAWFGLRLLPSLMASLFVLTVFSPAFGRFEPLEAGEAAGPVLLVTASVSALLIAWAASTAFKGWRRAISQTRSWLRRSDVLPCRDTSVPVYAVRDPHPIVSLVGLWRPRLFVSRSIADVLTSDELEAIVAHEQEHRSARDNLKRLVMLAAPDVLRFVSAGPTLESRWLSAAELEADRRAVRGDAARGLALASALVKVARLMPISRLRFAPVCDFYNGGALAVRIGRLAGSNPPPLPLAFPWRGLVLALLVCCASASIPAQATVHRITEFLVNFAG